MKPLSMPPVASSATPPARDRASLATVAKLNRLARWCAISLLLIGLLVLASWALQIEAIKSMLTDRATMKPNTALAFVLAGIALGLRQHSALRLGCALAVMLLGSLSLAQDISGANFGTDEMLFRDLVGAAEPSHPGRMSPITATCFTLLGGALALLGSRRAALRRALEALALLALMLAMLGMIGYAYDTEALYALLGFGSMALHTALAFALLGIGTLCARPDGLAGVFASDGLGGQLARRILPLVFLTPLLVGWLILQGEQAGLFNSRQKTAVFAATMMLMLLAFSWRSALQVESSDAKRLLAEALQRSVVEAAPNGLMLVDARGVITFTNGAMERLFGYTSQEMLGQTVEMFIPQHLRKPHLQQRDGFMADPQTRPMGAGRDLFGQRKDGSEFALEIGLRALQTRQGPFTLASVIDITERKQAERALRESEERLRTLGDNLPNSVVYQYAHDADGSPRFLYISAGTETLNGVRVPDVLRDSGTLLGQIPPEHAAQLAQAEARSARDLSDFVVEVPMRHADGRLRWMRLQSRPRRLPSGQVVWDGVQTDISQQKRLEGNLTFLADLQEMFARLTSSVEISRVASRRIAEHLGLRSCLLTEIDQAAGQATVLHEYLAEGASALQHVRPLTELRTAAQRQALAMGKTLVSPDVLGEDRGAVELQRLAARGVRSQVSAPYLVEGGHWKFLLTALRGQPYDWPQDEVELITELAARVYVHIERARAEEALQIEVAAHQQAEDELRASNERTQIATQATGVGIWEWNLLDDTIRWDAQMFYIYGLVPTPDGLVPYSVWRDCVLPEDLPRQEALLQGTIASGGSGKREFRIQRGNDVACRHIEAGETVRNNADGKPEWVVGTNLDITERSRLEQETQAHAQTLVRLDRRKDEFLAMLGHELRNPLAAISNAVQLLQYQKSETPMQQKARQVIERQVGQLTHLVDDLLEVSRVTSGNVRLRKEPASIGSVVQRAVETVQPLIAQHRHALALSLPPQPLFLHADTARLEQVLVNLLTNAAKYTEDGGRIWLSVQCEDDKVVIKVRDNGIGMVPELLPHIFELFTQAERSLDRSQGGLGIGLSLVQQLVELHGGTVTADSVLGQGSEFVVRLPAMPPKQEPAPTPASQTSERRGKESTICQVLVVEDNVDAAQSLATLLEISGCQVRLAYDGPSAVQAATDYRPDVVLLDIGLPRLDGYEVAAWMRQQAALKGVVLVALTGYGQDADHQRSQDAGFDYHLTKPVNFDEIKKILASVAPVVT